MTLPSRLKITIALLTGMTAFGSQNCTPQLFSPIDPQSKLGKLGSETVFGPSLGTGTIGTVPTGGPSIGGSGGIGGQSSGTLEVGDNDNEGNEHGGSGEGEHHGGGSEYGGQCNIEHNSTPFAGADVPVDILCSDRQSTANGNPIKDVC